jgi:DNA-binding MarR family transcriptional regulator
MANIKYVGTKKLIDPETGEILNMEVVSKNYDILDRKGWRRVFLADLMTAIEQIGNKKLRVLEYLVDNMDANNFINKTQRQIKEETGLSIGTINETFNALYETNLIIKTRSGYAFNGGIISAFGSKEKNKMLLIKYQTESIEKEYDIEKEIEKQQNKLERLLKIKEMKEKIALECL